MTIARRLIIVATWGYLAVVILYWLALWLIGERWWLTTVALYLPHAVALAPALPLALLLGTVGPRRFIPVPVVAVLVIVFPIMGLVVCGGAEDPSGTPRLRVLSYNVDSGRRSIPQLAAQVVGVRPDIVLLQEGDQQVGDQVTALLPDFVRHSSGQFYLASRWPIVDVYEPPKVVVRGVDRTPRFIRYTLDTPLGLLDVFNVHPASPRDGFESIRGSGLQHEVESGGIFATDRDALVHNTELRRAQAATIASRARLSQHPVIIAGDTNLPESSDILADTLGHFQDGFDEVGRGFGYTFPAHTRFAWMRIDRIFAGSKLRFLQFGVGARRGSDHYCVWADLELRR